MSKGVFEQNIDEMLEFDRELDVNSLLESIPAIETTPEKKEEVVEEDKGDKKESPLKDINKVLEKQSAEVKDKTAEEDEVKVIKKDDAPDPNVQPENASDALFTVIFAKDLVSQGLLSSFDEAKFLEETKEVGEAEALRNLIKTEIETNIEAAKSDLDAGYQEYLNMIGKGVPAETAGNLVELKNKFDTIKIEDLTKEENVEIRRKVMTDYFKLTSSMPDSKIEKIVQSSIDLGDDVDDAKEYLNTLKTLIGEQISLEEAEAAKQKKLIEDENRRSIEALKESINSLNEVIPGVSINKQTKNQMFEAITKPVQDNKGRTTNALWAKRAEDPKFFDERLAYLYATGFFEKDKPWTKAAQSKTTKEISELERALKSKNNTESKVGSPILRGIQQDKTTKDNIDSMRDIFGK